MDWPPEPDIEPDFLNPLPTQGRPPKWIQEKQGELARLPRGNPKEVRDLANAYLNPGFSDVELLSALEFADTFDRFYWALQHPRRVPEFGQVELMQIVRERIIGDGLLDRGAAIKFLRLAAEALEAEITDRNPANNSRLLRYYFVANAYAAAWEKAQTKNEAWFPTTDEVRSELNAEIKRYSEGSREFLELDAVLSHKRLTAYCDLKFMRASERGIVT
jgi:hypothetical protein